MKNLVRREEDEEEETEKTLSARFSAEDFARKRDVILISVCSSGVGGGEEGSFVSSSFSSPSPTRFVVGVFNNVRVRGEGQGVVVVRRKRIGVDAMQPR